VCYPVSRVWDTWWTEWHGTGFSPSTSVICCQYISTSAPHALQFSPVRMSPHARQFSAVSMSAPVPAHRYFSFLLSVCLHHCSTRTFFLLSVCLDQFSTRILVLCCQYVSTRSSVFCCQNVSTSAQSSNSLSLTLYIQVNLAVDSIVK